MSILQYNEATVGTFIVYEGQPYEVLESRVFRMQQRKPVAQTKIRNLRSGKILQRTFHQNESFEEADIEREPVVYIYHHRNEYWFHKKEKSGERLKLTEEILGNTVHFLKENTVVSAEKFNGEVINIQIPVKVDLKVIETPPGVKGDTAQGGSKEAKLETGYRLNVPLFINEGDVIRINTETGEYTERVHKE